MNKLPVDEAGPLGSRQHEPYDKENFYFIVEWQPVVGGTEILFKLYLEDVYPNVLIPNL